MTLRAIRHGAPGRGHPSPSAGGGSPARSAVVGKVHLVLLRHPNDHLLREPCALHHPSCFDGFQRMPGGSKRAGSWRAPEGQARPPSSDHAASASGLSAGQAFDVTGVLPKIHTDDRNIPRTGVKAHSWILRSLYVFRGASPGRLRGRARCGAGGATLITTALCLLRGHQGPETLPLLFVFVPSTAEHAEGTTSWRLPLSRRRWWTSSPA